MEENFFDFAQTKEALSQLSADLVMLGSEIKSKAAAIERERQDYQTSLSDNAAKISALQNTIRDTIAKIDSVNDYIDGVL